MTIAEVKKVKEVEIGSKTYKNTESESNVKETKKKSKIYTISGEVFAAFGMKPESIALEMFLEAKSVPQYCLKHDSELFNILVAGDGCKDLLSGYNLDKWAKNKGLESKVRVHKVLVNRHGKSDPRADYTVSSLWELYVYSKVNNIKVAFIDADNTLYNSCMIKEEYKPKSKIEDKGKSLFLRTLYSMTMIEADIAYSWFFANSRYVYPKSESKEKENKSITDLYYKKQSEFRWKDDLRAFLNAMTREKMLFCISSFSCFKGLDNIVRRCGANAKVIKPYLQKPSLKRVLKLF